MGYEEKSQFPRIPTGHLDTEEYANRLQRLTARMREEKIDAMLAKVAELKALLIERRTALITDVVTGRKEVA